MSQNLYESLGVKKEATKDEIKRAYRKKVKKHHPDKGGDKEVFLDLQIAWTTLRDETSREEYDRTGKIHDGRSQDSRTHEALQRVITLVTWALSEDTKNLGHTRQTGFTTDYIAIAKRELIKQREVLVARKAASEKICKFLKKATPKFKRKVREGQAENDFLKHALETHIRQIEQAMIQMESEIASLDISLQLVEDYTFELDEDPDLDKFYQRGQDIILTINEPPNPQGRMTWGYPNV